MAACMPLYNSH